MEGSAGMLAIIQDEEAHCIFTLFVDFFIIAITLRNVSQFLAYSIHPDYAERRAVDDLLIAGHCFVGDGVDYNIAYFFEFYIQVDGALVFCK